MKERDRPAGRAHAPLRPHRWGERVRVTRHEPGELAPWVEREFRAVTGRPPATYVRES